VKNLYSFILIGFLIIFYACTENIIQEESFKPKTSNTTFNDFIDINPFEVPNLKIDFGKYFKSHIGKYKVNTWVDVKHPELVYLKIEDTTNNTIYEGFTQNGKKNGWWEVKHNKAVICNGNYILDKKCGFWSFYKLNKQTQKFVNFKNDTLEGLAQEYTLDSILRAEGNYVGGQKSDYWKCFYSNGNIKEQGYFFDGFKSGWWQSFEINGNLIEEASYSRNEISGYVKKYFKGILLEEGKLYNKSKRGTWKLYDDTGKLKRLVEHEK